MPEATLTQIAASLDLVLTRLERVESAIVGDESIGHRGLTKRVMALEAAERSFEATHEGIDNRRLEGDRRLHERLDESTAKLDGEVQRIEKKLDRIIWVAAGIGIASGGGAALLAKAFGG